MDKIFVLDNFNIVLDKKYFVRADGRGIRANFCHKMNVQKNFQLKIPTLRKMIAAPSGGQTKFEKKSLGANSGMFIGTKQSHRVK